MNVSYWFERPELTRSPIGSELAQFSSAADWLIRKSTFEWPAGFSMNPRTGSIVWAFRGTAMDQPHRGQADKSR
ncbi:MAG: hypothetical protein EOP82_32500 [Variovorax sp.]|nr:MAG: hypothetical protein EOP82_32500 [Variovorax sp.]